MHQRLDIGNGSNRQQIHAEDDAPAGHVLGSDLAPPARGGTQVDAHLRGAEEVILLVDLETAQGTANVGKVSVSTAAMYKLRACRGWTREPRQTHVALMA